MSHALRTDAKSNKTCDAIKNIATNLINTGGGV
jgi:hypothetical protein